ncbi:MAG: hypothetical protein L0L75_02310, partial [Enterobacterales bacterium]|nr:hypothetical protein [Enterobacterales bacterium]
MYEAFCLSATGAFVTTEPPLLLKRLKKSSDASFPKPNRLNPSTNSRNKQTQRRTKVHLSFSDSLPNTNTG